MTQANNYAPITQIGNGVTTVYTGPWNPISLTYLKVYLQNVISGVQTLQSQGTDYTAAITTNGFTVTFVTAPTSANYVLMARSVVQDQTVPYKTSKGFQGDIQENSYDKLTAIVQDLQEQLNRSIKLALGSTLNLTLPPPTPLGLIGYDATGTLLQNYLLANVGTYPVTPFAATLLDDVDAATARGTLGLGALAVLNSVPAATTTSAGIVQLTTSTDITTGTNNTKAATPLALKTAYGFSSFFESTEQNITASGNLSLSHGLSALPKIINLVLRCKTAELGYAVGDEVEQVQFIQSAGYNMNIWCNTASIGIAVVNTPWIISKTTSTGSGITAANWKYVFRAWA